MASIERSEQVVLLSLLGFAIVWILLIVPWIIQNSWFLSLNPLFQYLLYNIGQIILFTIIIGIPVSYFIDGKFDIVEVLISGITMFLLFSFVLDMYAPPFAYDSNGNILITNTAALPSVSVDRAAGWVWGLFGVSGALLYIAVYIITPIIALLPAAYLFKDKIFIKGVARR